jgi:hypothetical protein
VPERLGPRSPFVGSSHVARLPWPPGVVRGTLTTSQAAAELSKFPVSAPDDVKPIDARFRHGVDHGTDAGPFPVCALSWNGSSAARMRRWRGRS